MSSESSTKPSAYYASNRLSPTFHSNELSPQHPMSENFLDGPPNLPTFSSLGQTDELDMSYLSSSVPASSLYIFLLGLNI